LWLMTSRAKIPDHARFPDASVGARAAIPVRVEATERVNNFETTSFRN
jgi:hypothetical protein